eukprot:scaffold4194_cov131-Isochrysis_galbana.AAC.12
MTAAWFLSRRSIRVTRASMAARHDGVLARMPSSPQQKKPCVSMLASSTTYSPTAAHKSYHTSVLGIDSHETALPPSGVCSCRFTPLTVIGAPLTRSSPPEMLTDRSPTRHVSTSTTHISPSTRPAAAAAVCPAALRLGTSSSSTSEYRLGSSADHSAGACSVVLPRARTGAPLSESRPCASSACKARCGSVACGPAARRSVAQCEVSGSSARQSGPSVSAHAELHDGSGCCRPAAPEMLKGP